METLPEAGKPIAKRIEEIIETGKLHYRRELKANLPVVGRKSESHRDLLLELQSRF